jgi:hypothetical protein
VPVIGRAGYGIYTWVHNMGLDHPFPLYNSHPAVRIDIFLGVRPPYAFSVVYSYGGRTFSM